MTYVHLIKQAHLEFDFTGFADAEIFETQAAAWVSQHVLPVVEAVFDEVCPEHQTLVIDSLTLDLGSLDAKTFYTQAPEKLRQVLREKLNVALRAATQALQNMGAARPGNAESPDMTILSQKQQRWNILWQFLSTGILPWSVSGLQPLDALGFSDMLTEHAAQFTSMLNQTAHPEHTLRRVVEQFPVSQIAGLFPLLTSEQQWQMMLLLLAHPKSHTDELAGHLTEAWFARITQFFAQHNLAPLRLHWEKLIKQFAPQLIKALYLRHSDSQLPGNLVRDLAEDERLLLLSVLTPQDYPFLATILRAPAWWQMESLPPRRVRPPQALRITRPTTLLPQEQIQQHLWLFTFQYLLVDRGSTFNRQSYMKGLIVRMAHAQNQTAEILLASLISALNSSNLDSTLRGQLLDLLYTIQPAIASANPLQPKVAAQPIVPEGSTPPVGEAQRRDINELVLALCSGPENQLIQYWPRERQPFAALLRWCGQLDYVRRHWAETYSDKTLLALIDVLDPAATPLIRLLAANMERTMAAYLWKQTFTFLIVEKGKETFHPQNYLHYVIQQLAAWHRGSYSDLLERMHHSVLRHGDFSVSGISMNSLLEDLTRQMQRVERNESHPALLQSSLSSSLVSAFSVSQLTDIEEILTTLKSADQQKWDRHIKRWQHEYGRQLPLIIRDTGCPASVITGWVTHFDDSALSTLTAIINPHAAESVRTLINQRQPLGAAINQTTTNTRNALWELTLHYLISRRGSEFNQYQYLLSITEQLSARYQIKTEVLIEEWLNLSESGFLWRQQLLDLIDDQQRPPVTAPELLATLQFASDTSMLGQQQSALLHHYAASNAAVMATQLQTWNAPELARLLRIMQPLASERVTLLLPLLLDIVRRFHLAPHWFYPLLMGRDCPSTAEQWLQHMLRQINRHAPSAARSHYQQLRQLVLSSQAIHQRQDERKRWLYSIIPEEELSETVQRWLEGKAPAPEQALLLGVLRHSRQNVLLQWLQQALVNPRYLKRWCQMLSPEIHRMILLPTLTRSAIALLAIRRAVCPLFGSWHQGEPLFWQTLYHLHWIKGIALTGNALMRELLTELNRLWLDSMPQGQTSPDTSVAGLIAQLLPLVSSPSLRKTLADIASQAAARQPDGPKWADRLHDQRPEIKQLIEAIEMLHKDVKKSAGILWKNPQDDPDISSDPVTIHNAGLVIASPYIPMLFQRLGLTNGSAFVDIQAQHQALFCLQWMTNCTNNAPEYQLLLNKVLCGVAATTPIPQLALLPDGAETLIDGLLTALIAHWKVLGNTSISALQSTFIQREGLLMETPKHWQLNIVPGSFDMLLDHLPWSFQTLKYPWMDKPLFVSWR